MDDDRVPGTHAGHRVADRLHPARVLVAEGVGELDVDLVLPDPLDDVEVGAAEAGAADPDDDVVVSVDVGLGNGVDPQWLVVGVEPSRSHTVVSSSCVG